MMLDKFKTNKEGANSIEFANSIREILCQKINKANSLGELNNILDMAITSTGIDLSKREGSKDQTSFALDLVEKCNKESSPDKLLELVFSIRNMPKEPSSSQKRKIESEISQVQIKKTRM